VARVAARAGKTANDPQPVASFVHRNLPHLLLRAREHLMRRFRPILGAHGLTEQQWRIVRALLETGSLEPRQIGDICQLSSPSLVGVLQRMEDTGLVSRARMAHDQRRVRVALTRKSRTLAARIAPLVEAEYRLVERELGTDVVRRLYEALDVILAAAPRAAGTRKEHGHEASS
jgi:homoprotocatechuate degradation regulator HpaR